MIDWSLILHNEVLSVFNDKYFEKVLTAEHINNEGVVNFPKVKATDGEDKLINFFGWKVTKNGITWLVPNTKNDGTPVHVKDIFPLIPSKWEDVGYQSKAYRYVHSYKIVKYACENRLGMRGLIDALSSTPHTNPKHRKLLIMAVLSQVFHRAYYRFCSPPGFGKDNIVDTMGLLIGNCATIENPSVPKLEREASIRTLTGLNEVVGLTRSQWVDIGKFMLAACAFKPSITKRTRAFGNVGEVINLRNFSMSVFYNDKECYNDPKIVYFDDLAEEGILDRLPSLRLHGHFTYDFNSINNIDVEQFVIDNWDSFLDIIYTITYFKYYGVKQKYKYDISQFPQRWQRSLGLLLMVASEYSIDQKEFSEWVSLLKSCITDYNAMIDYGNLLSVVKGKLSSKEYNELSTKLIKEETYTNRIKMLDSVIRGNSAESSKNKDIKGYW